jgi:D-alanyl-lipoteichoic acid acyltransferase DltB (MBOAT superfamily)
MVIADAVANFVSMVYSKPRSYPGSALALATLLFAIQIYCDFSGYTDIALGLARVMGYELCINFRQPYFSRSIGEFWHRWHISLSTWFRDYLYIPLGGNRVAVPRYYVNLLATFLISGLWHGAAWTFVLWGGLHGAYLILGQVTSPLRNRIQKISRIDKLPLTLAVLQTIITAFLVLVAWVFFRAANIGDAFYVVTHMLPLGRFDLSLLSVGGIPRANVPFLIVFILLLFTADWWLANPSQVPRAWSSKMVRQSCYWFCAYSVICFGVFGHVDFIYFQF